MTGLDVRVEKLDTCSSGKFSSSLSESTYHYVSASEMQKAQTRLIWIIILHWQVTRSKNKITNT